MSKRIVFEFPIEMPEGSSRDKGAIQKGKEAMVLELLRKGQISQGKAAELLEIDRWALFDLMAKNNMPMANFSAEELQHQRDDSVHGAN